MGTAEKNRTLIGASMMGFEYEKVVTGAEAFRANLVEKMAGANWLLAAALAPVGAALRNWVPAFLRLLLSMVQ